MRCKLKIIFLLFIVICNNANCLCQNAILDSLFNVISKHKGDTTAYEALILIGQNFIFINPDSSFYYLQKARKLSEQINYTAEVSNYYRSMGMYYDIKGNADSAYYSYYRAIELDKRKKKPNLLAISYTNLAILFSKKKEFEKSIFYSDSAIYYAKLSFDSLMIAKSFITKGNVFFNMRNYIKAVEMHTLAARIYERLSALKELSRCYINIGNVYSRSGYDKEAIPHYKNALAIISKSGDKNLKGIATGNLGIAYQAIKQPDSALYYFSMAALISEEIKNKNSISINYHNIGSLFIDELRLPDSALVYLNKAMLIRKERKNKTELMNTAVLIAKCYNQKREYLKALKIINENEFKDELKDWIILIPKHEQLAKAYEGMGKLSAALEHYKLFKLYTDSIKDKERDEKLAEKLAVFETEKKQAEIEKTQKELQLQTVLAENEKSKRNIAIAGAAVVLLMVTSGGYVIYNNRQSKNKLLLQKSELEKNMIENNFLRSRMDPHFVSNALLSVNDFVGQKKNKLAQEYLDRFNQMMRWILENSSREMVTLAEELEMLNNYFILEKPRMENGLEWTINIADGIDINEIEIPPLILQPFVENAVKHGISGLNNKGEITISVIKAANKITCIIEDNGRGIDLNKIKTESNGIKLTRERLNLFTKLYGVDATLNISRLEHGTRVTISFTT